MCIRDREYGEDIISGRERDVPDMTGGTDKALLEHELKLSCTNVMLQCLDAESRCIYILGTMSVSYTHLDVYKRQLLYSRKELLRMTILIPHHNLHRKVKMQEQLR